MSGEENKRKEGVCVYFFIYFRWKEVPPHGANQCLPSILACNVPFPLVLIASHRSKFSKLDYSETPVATFSRSSALRVSNAKSRDARVENVGIQNGEKRHTVSSHAMCVEKFENCTEKEKL